jgi:outer membrane protein OmpA-like peptidoglycan-associated protein/tetratricopeptide (TPR) repeat protein
MKAPLLLTAIGILFCFSTFAQNKEFDSKNFSSDKQGLKDALKEIKTGDEAYYDLNYAEALKHYLVAGKFNPDNADLNLKTGNCYIHSAEKNKAIAYIEKAIRLSPEPDLDMHYLLGKAYHFNFEWDKAIAEYSKCLGKKTESNDAEFVTALRKIEECLNGAELMKTPVKVKIENLGEAINTANEEYCPIISADESVLFFTSRRPGSTGGQQDPENDNYYEDIYSSEKKDGKWTPAKNLGAPVNSERHDATVNLSVDGQRLFIYRDESKINANILESLLEGSKWSEPHKLNSNINTPFQETSASFTPDEKSIYFVTNAPGGRGGKDIYVSRKTATGEWGHAENLGPPVNSDMDEDAVFMHPDGKTLYFCSNGHKTMGGFDIFKTVLENGKWSDPVNLGYPINTPDNDVSYVISASGKHAYYASAGEGSLGKRDIFMITFLEDTLKKDKKEEPQLTLVSGIITDETSGKPLGADVEIVDNAKNESVAKFKSNAETGKYLVSLPSGKNYALIVKSPEHLFHSENFDIPILEGYNEINKPIVLKKPEVGKKIILNNIFYDFDKSDLRNESLNELSLVFQLLNEMPTLKIELSSHTDSKGGEEYNIKLSQARAQSVVDYLVKRGITKDRLIAKGYGKSQPVATNETDEGRQLNRRTEFKILYK